MFHNLKLRSFKELHDKKFLAMLTKSRAWIEGWISGSRRLREQVGNHVAHCYAAATLGEEPDFGEDFPNCKNESLYFRKGIMYSELNSKVT
jgi:hypothetical protein